MPTDFLESAVAVGTALKSAMEIAKGLAPDGSPKQAAQLAQLQTALLSSLDHAIESKAAQIKMQQKIGELETRIANIGDWNTEAEKYQPHKIDHGVVVYALKSEALNVTLSHALCPNCFHSRRKSFLQRTSELRRRYHVHHCPACKADYEFDKEPPPRGPDRAVSDFHF